MKYSAVWINGSWRFGTWAFAIFHYGVQLKAPWNLVYFSERYGFKPTLIRVHNWRLLLVKP